MSSMLWINSEGQPCGKVAFKSNLPENFPWREGFTMSWENQFFDTTLEVGIIHSGEATIIIEEVISSLMVRVEARNRKSLNQAVEKVILLAGGSISTFEVAPTTNQSFVGGVKNDLLRLKQWVVNGFRSIRQRTGMAII